ncbi:cyclin-F isoform X2 [Brienomyrus brachyistius]|uniref:cyclin-F isoform X2 n=1 Tax=Brienomyrus brachyistius TaxID=42636 RepID=UPI0020B30337|nr:cyclin-F isoform X2 [Brienomyrus brachyistius]
MKAGVHMKDTFRGTVSLTGPNQSVLHCRCSKCFSAPVKKRVRRRPSALTLLSLPEEVLLCVLQCLSAQDLLAVRAVHSQLRDLVDGNSRLWARVSFANSWPSADTLWLYERAADKGNFEAAVKLGIAYLYNEGPSLSDEGRAEICGRKASHFFSLAESLRAPTADPFVWVFIRPPWSPSGNCCKAVVFDHLKAECSSQPEKRGSLLHCLARVLQFFDEEEKLVEALDMLEESSRRGCLQSSYLLWEHQRRAAMADPGRYLQCLRTLRDYAAKGCWEAQLSLAKACSSANPLGLDPQACADQVAQLFQSQSAQRRRPEDILRHGIKDTMRYILVDWLVEVTTMKDFSSLVLHVTVGCVDRYLALHSVPKARLQLLGIACMVICTRYISKEILTIREAVWLTDNTYKYEDLVRMMGEVMSALEGKMRTPTLLDYGEVLLSLLPLERRSAHLFSYICELSLLYTDLTLPSPARLACAALLLTRAMHHYAPVWPPKLAEHTGFSKQDLIPSAVLLYTKCFSDDIPTDYRHVSLTGVKQRFEDEAYQQISKEEVMGFRELCQILGIPEQEQELGGLSSLGQPGGLHTFLSSPTSDSKRRRSESGTHNHRGSFVATPTAELSTQEETLLGDILEWSLDTSCSGYEGDQESEGERDAETLSGLAPEILLTHEVQPADLRQHCRALSSDEDSLCESDADGASQPQHSGKEPLLHTGAEPSPRLASVDLQSSGYSSVQSPSPSSSCSSPPSLISCTLPNLTASSVLVSPGFCPLMGTARAKSFGRRQVKRKNGAAHSGGEEAAEGFLSL